jgi:hypothetical protein
LQTAFASFTHPYAWLIRGLLEYGWQDLSVNPRNLPIRTGFGFDLNPLVQSGGKTGIKLVALARDSKGEWLQSDSTYVLHAKLGEDQWRRPAFLLRSIDLGRASFFLYSQENPIYAAGYLHQAVGEWVPEFVDLRSEGHQSSPESLQQLEDISSGACPQALAYFLSDRIAAKKSMDTAAAEGLWIPPVQHVQEPMAAPTAQQPNLYTSDQTQRAPGLRVASGLAPATLEAAPMITAGRGQGAQITSGVQAGGPTAVAGLEKSVAMSDLENPSYGLYCVCVMGFAIGIMEIINATLTAHMVATQTTVRAETASYNAVIIISMLLGLYSMGMGALAFYGIRFFQRVEKHWLSFVPLVYAATLPICTCVGLPIAGWATWVWTRPHIKAIWKGEDKSNPR